MPWFSKTKSSQSSTRLHVDRRFELLREAVHGTMSEFYLARDRQTGQTVGLKILDAEKTAAFEARFKGLQKPTEGEITCKVDHPRIVEAFEYGLTDDDRQYVVMEYLEGATFSALILRRDEALIGNRIDLICQMAEALQAVHEAGFIHRDICPRNYIGAPDRKSLKLIDFGLTVPATRQFTGPGNRTGTPQYMAPEIIRRLKTDHRLDVFALGVTAYQLLTFELPWPSGDTSGKVAMLHATMPPVEILKFRPRLDPKLADVVMRCLAVSPDDRPASAEEFHNTVRRVTAEEAS